MMPIYMLGKRVDDSVNEKRREVHQLHRKKHFGGILTWVLKSEVWFRLCVLLVDNLLADVLRQYLVEHVVHG